MIDGREIAVSSVEALDGLDWGRHGVDLVFECTGAFTSRERAAEHLRRGSRQVMFSQPADADVDATIVYGINHGLLRGDERVVSAASCTTNCIVPVIDTLARELGLECGMITTIHSAMNDQPVLDAYHHTDLRKTRAALQSMIPVDTGLAAGIGRVLPELAGRFEAQAMRVPTLNVSAIDLSAVSGDRPRSRALTRRSGAPPRAGSPASSAIPRNRWPPAISFTTRAPASSTPPRRA